MFIFKSVLIWLLIASIEVAHGILRARFLAPKVGDLRSRQIAVFTGSGLIYLTTDLSFSWLQLNSVNEAFAIGGLWFFLMVSFELLLGHYYFKFSWKWLLNDFNILKGRLLLFGMIFLALAPYLVGHHQGHW